MHLCRHLASKLELRLGDARLIGLLKLLGCWLCCGVKTSGTLARTKKSLKNLFLEKIIIPPQKSIPFNVIKRVQ